MCGEITAVTAFTEISYGLDKRKDLVYSTLCFFPMVMVCLHTKILLRKTKKLHKNWLTCRRNINHKGRLPYSLVFVVFLLAFGCWKLNKSVVFWHHLAGPLRVVNIIFLFRPVVWKKMTPMNYFPKKFWRQRPLESYLQLF